jgi:WD40 repeat protein
LGGGKQVKDNPYVGPRPYERGDQSKFYGRNREARDLLALLLAERTVLFYAKSGAGKTSLLNAQVIPALEKEGFRVLPVARVSSDAPSGVVQEAGGNVFVCSVLMSLAGADMTPERLQGHTLTSFLQALCQHPDSESEGDAPFLLILDQFEELFTTHRDRWQDAEGFFIQVRDALEALPGMGVLFAMREDYLAELDPYLTLLPKRMRARFRMELLGPEGALEAIIQPALSQGIGFDEGVAERMVDDLRRIRVQRGPGDESAEATAIGPFVEPVQLQVVCSRLWENLPDQEDKMIQWAEVEEYGRIDRALTDFYRSALDDAQEKTGASQKQLRRWFGNELITPMQTRGLVLRGPETTGTLPNAAVDVLSRHYIIRSEVRAGARWYELAHDRLIAPILSSNQGWEAKRSTPLRMTAKSWQATKEASFLYRDAALEEAMQWVEAHPLDAEPYEREFIEASRLAQQAHRRRRTVQILAAVLGVVVLALITFLAWSAERSRMVARSREAAADALAYSMEKDQINSILQARKGVLLGDPTYRDASTPLWRPLLGEIDTLRAQSALRQALVDFYPVQTIGNLPGNPYSVVYSADGRTLYVGNDVGQVTAWTQESNWLRQATVYETRGATWSLALSPDGRILAAGGDDNRPKVKVGTVGLLDLNSGEWLDWLVVPTPLGVYDDIYAVAFSSDGYYLATGGDYDNKYRDYTGGMTAGIVRVWQLATRGDTLLPTAVLTLTEPTARVHSVAFDPRPLRNIARSIYEPYYLAAASFDGAVYIWALTSDAPGSVSATLAHTLRGHTGAVNAVAYSPTEDILASASEDKTIRIWDPHTGQELLTLTGHTSEVESIAFSADGHYLISGSRDLTVRVWDVMARNPNALLTLLSGPRNLVTAVAFSPDNRFLVAGTQDHALRVWNQGFVARQGLTTLSGHESRVRGVAYSPDGVHLASSDDEGWTRIWDVTTGEPVRDLSPVGGTVWNLTYSPDGQYLVTCAADNNAYVWDQTSARPIAVLEAHTADVEDAEFSGDGRYLVTGGDDQKGILWNTTTWTTETELTIPGFRNPGQIWNVAYSPDGRWIATGYSSANYGASVVLWQVDVPVAGTPIQVTPVVTFTDHGGNYVLGLSFSPDSRYLASVAWDGTARIWSTETLTTALKTPLRHPNDVNVYSVAFSPQYANGNGFLATGARDGIVRLWYLQDFPEREPVLIAELGGHTDLVWSVSFSPDGKHLASGSWDRTIRRYLVPFEDVWALAEVYVSGVPEVQIASVEEQR